MILLNIFKDEDVNKMDAQDLFSVPGDKPGLCSTCLSLRNSVGQSVGRSVTPSLRHSVTDLIVLCRAESAKFFSPLPISPHFLTRYARSNVRRVETSGRPFVFFSALGGNREGAVPFF